MATRAQRATANLLLQCFDLCEEAGFEAYHILEKYIFGNRSLGLDTAIYHGLRKSHIIKSQSSDYSTIKPALMGATRMQFQGFPQFAPSGKFIKFTWVYRTFSRRRLVKLSPKNPNHLKSGYYYTIKSTKALIQACLNVPVVAERFTEKVNLEVQKVLIRHI